MKWGELPLHTNLLHALATLLSDIDDLKSLGVYLSVTYDDWLFEYNANSGDWAILDHTFYSCRESYLKYTCEMMPQVNLFSVIDFIARSSQDGDRLDNLLDCVRHIEFLQSPPVHNMKMRIIGQLK